MTELKRANYQVHELWTVDCPHCGYEQEAPFNAANPMQPMTIVCDEASCGLAFILTYERGD